MREKADSWTKINSEQIADCEVFTVHKGTFQRDRDGERAEFYLIDNPDWVNVIAVTKEGEAVFIEQYRPGSESMIFEIPGGMVDAGGDPEATVRRELAEETGYTCGRLSRIGCSYPNPAQQGNQLFHYLALDCEPTRDVKFDQHESIVTRLVPLREIGELVHNGTITHSLAIAAIYYAQRYLKDEGFLA